MTTEKEKEEKVYTINLPVDEEEKKKEKNRIVNEINKEFEWWIYLFYVGWLFWWFTEEDDFNKILNYIISLNDEATKIEIILDTNLNINIYAYENERMVWYFNLKDTSRMNKDEWLKFIDEIFKENETFSEENLRDKFINEYGKTFEKLPEEKIRNLVLNVLENDLEYKMEF